MRLCGSFISLTFICVTFCHAEEPEPIRDAPRIVGEWRVVARARGMPIYDREVFEAIAQRCYTLPPAERVAAERAMFKQELTRIIERELIIEDVLSRLRSENRHAQIDEVFEICARDADRRMDDIRAKMSLPNQSALNDFLRSQGITVERLRRHFLRGAMMNIFLHEWMKLKFASIALEDLKTYYDEHPAEFQIADRVKWQDLFIRNDRFASRDDAKKYAEYLADRARAGQDFIEMVRAFDHRELPVAQGLGEEKDRIFPSEVEPTVLALKKGEVGVVAVEAGWRIVRVAERVYKGAKPFADAAVQSEIRKKVENRIGERAYRELVRALRFRAFLEEVLGKDKRGAEPKVVAQVRGTPIYDYEVRDPGDPPNFHSWPGLGREKELLRKPLHRLIERELIIDEMTSALRAENRTARIDEIQAMCASEAEKRLSAMRAKMQLVNDGEFNDFLTSQALTEDRLRRSFARDILMETYLKELVKAKFESITMEDLKKYYDRHAGEFYVPAKMEWSERTAPFKRFQNPAEAKRYAEGLVARFQKKPGPNLEKRADDLLFKLELNTEFETGAAVMSTAKTEAIPDAVAALLQTLKEGEVGMVQGLECYHVVRVLHRTEAERKILQDETVQQEIRDRLQNQIADRAYGELVKELRFRALVEEFLAKDKNMVYSP